MLPHATCEAARSEGRTKWNEVKWRNCQLCILKTAEWEEQRHEEPQIKRSYHIHISYHRNDSESNEASAPEGTGGSLFHRLTNADVLWGYLIFSVA